MYESLGIHWASSIPAFLALACVPAPFLFYKYGARIRQKQKYSREAHEMLLKIKQSEHVNDEGSEEDTETEKEAGNENMDPGAEQGRKSGEDRRGRSSKNSEAGMNRRDKETEPHHLNRASLIGADEDVDLEKGLVQ